MMTYIPENLASMNKDEIKEWIKGQIPMDEAYKMLTGIDPARKGNVSSTIGQGEDVNPSMSLDYEKNLFYCHRTGFGGDIFNLIAGKKNIPAHEFVQILETLKNYVLNRSHRQQNTGIFHVKANNSTAHLITKGIPKAWVYFKKAMEYGYPDNENIKRAIKQYMEPKYSHTGQDMTPLHDYTATQLGWCEISNALVIPYGLNGVEAMELVYFTFSGKQIGAYPFKTHRQHLAFQKLHTVNGDHSFFSGTDDRPKVDLKPWPAGIGSETPPLKNDLYVLGEQGREVVICEGVKDAITARFHGFFAVAHHGGAFQAYKLAQIHNLFFDADGKETGAYVYAILDSDEAGRTGARKLMAEFFGRKHKPIIVDIGFFGGRGTGYDLHDFFTSGIDAGRIYKLMYESRLEAGYPL